MQYQNNLLLLPIDTAFTSDVTSQLNIREGEELRIQKNQTLTTDLDFLENTFQILKFFFHYVFRDKSGLLSHSLETHLKPFLFIL